MQISRLSSLTVFSRAPDKSFLFNKVCCGKGTSANYLEVTKERRSGSSTEDQCPLTAQPSEGLGPLSNLPPTCSDFHEAVTTDHPSQDCGGSRGRGMHLTENSCCPYSRYCFYEWQLGNYVSKNVASGPWKEPSREVTQSFNVCPRARTSCCN